MQNTKKKKNVSNVINVIKKCDKKKYVIIKIRIDYDY